MTVPNFTLSADRKTVRKNAGANGKYGFLSEQSLAAMGNKFTVELTTSGSDLMVGVALRDVDHDDGYGMREGSWMLLLGKASNCCFYCNDDDGTEFTTRTEISDGCLLCVRAGLL